MLYPIELWVQSPITNVHGQQLFPMVRAIRESRPLRSIRTILCQSPSGGQADSSIPKNEQKITGVKLRLDVLQRGLRNAPENQHAIALASSVNLLQW